MWPQRGEGGKVQCPIDMYLKKYRGSPTVPNLERDAHRMSGEHLMRCPRIHSAVTRQHECVTRTQLHCMYEIHTSLCFQTELLWNKQAKDLGQSPVVMVETRYSLLFAGHAEPFLQRTADTFATRPGDKAVCCDMYLVSHLVTSHLVRQRKEIK